MTGYRPTAPASFFPLQPQTIKEDAEIDRDIALLTTLLQTVRPGSTHSPGDKQPSRSPLQVWSHIAHVLAPGRDGVAVTGQLDPHSLTVTVALAQDASPQSTPEQAVRISQVELEGEETVSHLLDMVDETSDVEWDPRQHVTNVMSIIADFVRERPTGEREAAAYITFYHFIVVRSYRTLFARLQTASLVWGKHPLVALRDFYASADAGEPLAHVARPPSMVRTAKLSTLSTPLRRGAWYQDLLDSHGIRPDAPSDAGRVRYTVSASTAPAWARLLCHCYTLMVHTLATADGQAARLPGRADRRDLRKAMAALDDALDAGIVDRLFVDELVDQLGVQYKEKMEQRPRPPLVAALTDATRQAVEIDFGDRDDSADGLQAYPEEDGRQHITRHLSALVNPLRAAHSIVRTCLELPRSMDTLHVHSVLASPDASRLAVTPGYYESFKDKFVTWSGLDTEQVNSVLVSLQDIALNKVEASVHAEAALMSVLYPNSKGQTSPLVGISPFSGPIAVGVGKRCCYCCHALAQLLISGSGVAAMEGFALSGTHGTILPWAPPPGIPRKVLCEIRTRLLKVLLNTFKTSLVAPRSTQTLPVRPDRNSDEADVLHPSIMNPMIPEPRYSRSSYP